MPKFPHSSVAILVLLAVPQFAGASCRTTFESFHCQLDEKASNQAPAIASAPLPAQNIPELKWKRPWLTPMRAFEISLAGGIVADATSSWGCFESNPLLRSADGRFGAKGVAIKAGISGGGLLLAHLLHRKYPKLEKPLTFAFGGGSAWLHGVAIRNRAVGCLK